MENVYEKRPRLFRSCFFNEHFLREIAFAGIMPQRPSIRFNYLKQEGNKTGFRLYNLLLLALIYLEEASPPSKRN